MDLQHRFESWLQATYGDGPGLVVASGGAIGATTVHGWMKGRAKPGADALEVLHDLGCNITWLVTGEGPMFSDSARGREWARARNPKTNAVREPVAPAGHDMQRLIAELEHVLSKYKATRR